MVLYTVFLPVFDMPDKQKELFKAAYCGMEVVTTGPMPVI